MLKSRFPLHYEQPAGAGERILTAYAVDAGAAVSSTSCRIKVLLKHQVLPCTDIWRGTGTPGNMSWQDIKPGWNLLSVPVFMNAEETARLSRWLGSELWIWTAEGKYVPAAELVSGQGFWCCANDVPQTPGFELTGEIATSLITHKGWSLCGRICNTAALSAPRDYVYVFHTGTHSMVRKPFDQVPVGTGFWLFGK